MLSYSALLGLYVGMFYAWNRVLTFLDETPRRDYGEIERAIEASQMVDTSASSQCARLSQPAAVRAQLAGTEFATLLECGPEEDAPGKEGDLY